jgi:hypothetical protein
MHAPHAHTHTRYGLYYYNDHDDHDDHDDHLLRLLRNV